MRLRAAAALRVVALRMRVATALAGIGVPATRRTKALLPSSTRSATRLTTWAAGRTTRFSVSSAFTLAARSRRTAPSATRPTPLVAKSTATPTTLCTRSVPRWTPLT